MERDRMHRLRPAIVVSNHARVSRCRRVALAVEPAEIEARGRSALVGENPVNTALD
jgi:hypothetical protein